MTLLDDVVFGPQRSLIEQMQAQMRVYMDDWVAGAFDVPMDLLDAVTPARSRCPWSRHVYDVHCEHAAPDLHDAVRAYAHLLDRPYRAGRLTQIEVP